MNGQWRQTILEILGSGILALPRGKQTLELFQHTMKFRMREPVLTVPERKLSYQFMAAEAFWILSGDDTVAGIAPWNKRIADFSDDGERFFGAYGPKIKDQLPYVIAKLMEDPDTRQAGLTIWRASPPSTKDVPCTIAIFARRVETELNLHVFMRSSDAWLGLPYDVFNFSMLGHMLCCELNDRGCDVEPGSLYLTAASCHLYEPQWSDAKTCVLAVPRPERQTTPASLFTERDTLMTMLRLLRDSKPGDLIRWWS